MTEQEAVELATHFVEDKIENLGLELRHASREAHREDGPLWVVKFKFTKHPLGPTVEPDQIWVEVDEVPVALASFPFSKMDHRGDGWKDDGDGRQRRHEADGRGAR